MPTEILRHPELERSRLEASTRSHIMYIQTSISNSLRKDTSLPVISKMSTEKKSFDHKRIPCAVAAATFLLFEKSDPLTTNFKNSVLK